MYRKCFVTIQNPRNKKTRSTVLVDVTDSSRQQDITPRHIEQYFMFIKMIEKRHCVQVYLGYT